MSPSPKIISPSRRSAYLSTPAFFRRFVTLLLASVLLLFVAGSALATIDAPRPLVGEPYTSGVWDPSELPDVALLVSGVESADPTMERLVIPALRDLPGVAAVTAELAPSGRIALHVALAPEADENVVAAIRSVVASSLPDAHVALGGRTVADQDLLSRLNRSTVVAVVPVVLLLTAVITLAFGGQLGIAAGGTVGLSTLLGGLVGSQIAGKFDGTLATTAVPAVLVAVLVSTVLTLRLLEWFKNPIGEDQAAAIRNSVRHLLPETGLLFGGLIVTALFLELLGTGRATASVVAAGGVIAAVITLGALPALLSTLERVPTNDEGVFSSELPDGRDFPIAVLGGFACFLLGLGLFAIRVPSSDLLDESALSSGVSSRRVSEQLIELGGDPSSAILAGIPATASSTEISAWSSSVSELQTVGWVQTSTGRFVAGELMAETDSTLFVQGDSIVAIVTPTVTARSEAAQNLIGQLETSGGEVFTVELSGAPVEAALVAASANRSLWIMIVLLAVSGGLAILVLVGDIRMAAATVALRFLGLGAVLGVYRVVAGDVGASELQVAVLVLSVGIGLFEIGFVRRITSGLEADLATGPATAGLPTSDGDDISEALANDRNELVTSALHREGRAAMFGLGVTALVGLGFLAGDLDIARRLGVAVAAAVVVEMMVGTWLLRPVVLGQRIVGTEFAGNPALFRSAEDADPQVLADASALLEVRLAGESTPIDPANINTNRSGSSSTDAPVKTGFKWREMLPIGRPLSATFAEERQSPEWRRIVNGLLRAEFAFQTDPDEAELETVFVSETPLFSELESHNQRLRKAGLSIIGQGPELVKVTAVNDESPVTLAITVDHPERRLLNAHAELVGIRPAERRHGMLWLVQDPSGRYRIAEAVDLGAGDMQPQADVSVAMPSSAQLLAASS